MSKIDLLIENKSIQIKLAQKVKGDIKFRCKFEKNYTRKVSHIIKMILNC